ncbi:MAG: DUF5317 family protein [Acidimicrobiia bacterium]
MLAYVVAILLAIAVVPLTHGRFDRLAAVRFSRPWLLAVGLGLQITLELVDLPRARFEDAGVGILLLSYLALLAFAASNIRLRGMELITLGIALNALVIALNLGMPYRVADGLPRETTVKHRPERASDIAVVLSDRLTIGAPLRAAISIGDLVLAAGLVELAYAGSRRRRTPERGPRPRRPPPFELSTDEHTVVELTDTGEIDLRDTVEPRREPADQPTGSASGATTRSSASSTRES